MKSRLQFAILIFGLAIASVCSVGLCCRSDTDKKPDWEATLTWPEPPPQKDCNWDKAQAGELVFTSPERAVVAVHIGCFRIELSQFDPERYLAAHTIDALYAVDVRTGNVINKLVLNDVSAKRERNLEMQIVALANHKILLRSDFTLKLLTDDFGEIASRNLIVEQEQWEHWKAAASANGSTLVLRRWGVGETNRGLSEDHWISTDTLQDLLVDDPKPYYSMLFTINDRGVYFNIKGVERMYGLHDDPIAFRAKGQTRYSLICAECTGNPLAVSNNGLLFADHDPHVEFMLIGDGRIQFRGPYGTRMDRISAVTVAAKSNRFAFDFGHGRTGLFSGDTETGGVIVFDAEEMKPVFSIKEKVYPDKEGFGETWLPPRISISPNGTQLLILNGSVLKAFSVPERTK